MINILLPSHFTEVTINTQTTTAAATDDYGVITPTLVQTFDCEPNDPTSLNFDIPFVADEVCEDDDTLVFEITTQTTGWCAGDPDHVTYDTVTYNILEDEGEKFKAIYCILLLSLYYVDIIITSMVAYARVQYSKICITVKQNLRSQNQLKIRK